MPELQRRRRRLVACCAAGVVTVSLVGTSAPVLATAPSVAAAASSPSSERVLLAPGARGPAVASWQARINAWLTDEGRPRLAVDGIFGPRTRAATERLQRRAGIAVDGVVGPRTRAALERLRGEGTDAPFDGTVGVAQRPSTGRAGAVTDVRFGSHEDFDRVVFDLTPGAHAGWHVEYVDSPVRSQGSGFPVPLEGDGQLSITLQGIAMPLDAGGASYDGPARPALGRTGVVEDLFVDNLYEGHFVTFVGTRSPEPFRVFWLEDPQRVVVDIAHPR